MNTSIIKNGCIILAGIVLGFGLFLTTKDAGNLAASVLDIVQMEKIKKSGRDVAYKHEDQLFELFGGEPLLEANHLSFQVLYNPDTIVLDLSSQSGFIVNTASQSGVYAVELSGFKNFALDHNLFEIKFTGPEKDILLGEAFFIDKKGDRVALKVGNLSIQSQTQHEN